MLFIMIKWISDMKTKNDNIEISSHKAVVFARVSSREQEQGQSIEAQLSIIVTIIHFLKYSYFSFQISMIFQIFDHKLIQHTQS